MSEPITRFKTSSNSSNSSNSSQSRNLYLPNGQRLTVLPVFGGFLFKSDEINTQNNAFPAGWTVILHTEHDTPNDDEDTSDFDDQKQKKNLEKRSRHTHPYRYPTLQNDSLFISSISNPPRSEFQIPTSPTRQIAMMLWTSLYWYFHQEEPSRYLITNSSKHTPDSGKPLGEWQINIKREGILRGRHLIQKLERMGLVMARDSSVGLKFPEHTAECWSNTFTSRRAFWQIPPKYFLFNVSPTGLSSLFSSSPHGSRPNSPVYGENKIASPKAFDLADQSLRSPSPSHISQFATAPMASDGQFPIYCPPAPLQYGMTSGIRHPLRPKPPDQGEIFYTRYIPSVRQYLSFRTVSLSENPVQGIRAASSPRFSSHHSNHSLPSITMLPNSKSLLQNNKSHHSASSILSIPLHIPLFSIDDGIPSTPSELISSPKLNDCQLLHTWMNIPRVSKFWNCDGPISRQENFLHKNLEKKHSFPVIGLWDDKPFGYFEIYWAKEDILSKYVNDGSIGDWDRGIHVLIGVNEFRGKHRVKCWLTALAHWVFSEDCRTNSIVLEPRIDNEKFISYLQETGFLKEREITFPHKQSALMRLRRDQFEAPVI